MLIESSIQFTITAFPLNFVLITDSVILLQVSYYLLEFVFIFFVYRRRFLFVSGKKKSSSSSFFWAPYCVFVFQRYFIQWDVIQNVFSEYLESKFCDRVIEILCLYNVDTVVKYSGWRIMSKHVVA